MNATENSKPSVHHSPGPDRGSIYHAESVEFHAEWDKYTVLSSDAEIEPDHLSYDPSNVESEPDRDRPHQKQDDSECMNICTVSVKCFVPRFQRI